MATKYIDAGIVNKATRSVIDATYDATEQAVLNNVRTRLNEAIAALQASGLMA